MLRAHGITDSILFSIKFECEGLHDGVRGNLYIGEHDDFRSNQAVAIPLQFYHRNTFWASILNSFALNNGNYEARSNYPTQVMFDTGCNTILLPMRYLMDIQGELKNFGCFMAQHGNNYQIACQANGNAPDLKFNFNGNILVMPKRYAYYYGPAYNYIYSTTIFTGSNKYVIGSPFFFVFHTLFDREGGILKFYPTKGNIIKG